MRPSAGIGVVEVQKLEAFKFFDMPARPSAEIGVVEVQKLEVVFLRFLRCPRDPLRGSAWSRCKKSSFLRFWHSRTNPLRRSCVSKHSRCGAVRILLSLGKPSAEIVRVEALSLWRRAIFVAREMAFGSCLVVCAPTFAIPRSRVPFPPGPRQLRLENCSF